MGRKKIQISRITDERNRQVRHIILIHIYQNYLGNQSRVYIIRV